MWKDMIERKYGHPDAANNPRHECPWCGWRAAYIGSSTEDGKTTHTFKCRRHGVYRTDGVPRKGWQVPHGIGRS